MKKIAFVLFAIATIGLYAFERDIPKKELKNASIVGFTGLESTGVIGVAFKGVFFVKLKDKNDVTSDEKVFFSKYIWGMATYLFNAEPGIYSVVGATYEYSQSTGPNEITIFEGAVLFPEELIKDLTVEVKENEMVFTGFVKTNMGEGRYAEDAITTGDKVQKYYSNKLFKDPKTPVAGYKELYELSDDTYKVFMKESKWYLKKTEWVDYMEKARKGH